MPQIFDIGPRFYFMKPWKMIKIFPFFDIKRELLKAYFKILRHGSLQMNAINMLVNF